MPLVKIKTSAKPSPEQAGTLLVELSKLVAKELGKPEAYVMTAIESGAIMTFGGTTAPAAYIELKSIGRFTAEKTKQLSAALCTELTKTLEVPADRTYIEFADGTGYLWGYDGETF
jgi:phenylpyruvate tautomerase PptA (4-oxalocrotonate tautomerase family)